MSEYIPFEIQAEILKRLPTKPLIQFRSVSKSYKCLIDSPDFIVSYHAVHHQPQPDVFILRYTFPHSRVHDRYLTFVDNDGDHGFVQQEFIPQIPDLIKTLKTHVLEFEPFSSVVGSSHGLLCFNSYYNIYSTETEVFVLWNPSIRKSIGIRAPYMYDRPNENFSDAEVHNAIGFGVSPVTFDPTILKISCIDYKRNRNDMSRISAPWKVRVFTLNTGTWSILSTNLPRESIRLRGSQVVIDRFIYWVAQDMIDAEDDRTRSQSHFLIMSFDLTAKEFKEINLKDSLTNRHCRIQTISNLQDSLVLLANHGEFEEDEESGCWCLWMMKEQGVSRSFTKLYTINLPDATINQILGFRKTGELILETQQQYDRYGEVQIYKRNYEYADNLGIDGEEYSFFMCSYMETLLLLDKSDGYIYHPIM